MTIKKCLILALIFLFSYSCGKERVEAPVGYLRAIEAQNHIGEVKTVCGKVVGARFVSSSRGKPTFLNVDRPYPNPIFTVVIWGNDRSNFKSNPENYYLNESVCVSGLIKSYEGVTQMEINNQQFISLVFNLKN